MQQLMLIAGNQVLAWALGLGLITVLLDTGPGFSRDHPPRGRRLAGATVGLLALLSVAILAAGRLPLFILVMVVPFAAVAVAYSMAWIHRWSASRRRATGRDMVIVGLGSMLLFMLYAGPQNWDGGIVISAYTASAALLGGLSTLLLAVLPGGKADEVYEDFRPYGIPARVIAAGLGITVLAVLGLPFGHTEQLGSAIGSMRLWLLLSLVMPALLVAVGHKLYKRFQSRFQSFIWATALLSALFGQAAIHSVMLLHPGMVPPSL